MSRLASITLLLGAALVFPALSACAGPEDAKAELKAAVDRTASLARQATYTEDHDGHKSKVDMTIADDLRYKVSYQYDGSPVLDETVVDDGRALRITQPAAVDRIAPPVAQPRTGPGVTTPAGAPPSQPQAAPATYGLPAPVAGSAQARPALSTVASLKQGAWVMDPVGAGPLSKVRLTGKVAQIGDDQVVDALTALRYVDDNIAALAGIRGGVVKFNKESIEYRHDLDPFPWPDTPGGEIRYDFPLRGLGPRAGTANTTQAEREQALPGPDYFRSLSVYVRNGLVESVRESVNIKRRFKDPRQDILPRIEDVGTKVPDSILNGSEDAKAKYIENYLVNEEIRNNRPPLRQREMTLTISGLGQSQDVAMPVGAVTASLAGILPRGLVLDQG